MSDKNEGIITEEGEGKNGMMTLWREKEDDTNGFWARCIQPLQKKNTWIKHCPGARQQDRLRCVTLNSPGRNIDSHLVPPPNRFTNEAGEDRRVMTPRRELSTCHTETAATAKTHYLLCAHSVCSVCYFSALVLFTRSQFAGASLQESDSMAVKPFR